MKKIVVLLIIPIVFTTHLIYSQGAWKMKGESTHLSGEFVNNIAEDGEGNIWFISSPNYVKSNKRFLNQYKISGEWYDFKNEKQIYKKEFYNLSYVSGKMVCYGKKGIYTYDGISWGSAGNENLREEYNLDKFNIREEEKLLTSSVDSLNRVWIPSNKGLLLHAYDTLIRYFENIDFSEYSTNNFISGYVTSNEGIFQYIDNDFVKIRSTDKNVTCQYMGVDSGNRVWFLISKKWNKDYFLSYYYKDSWVDYTYISNKKPTLYFRPNGTTWIKYPGLIAVIEDDIIRELPINPPKEYKFYNFTKMVFDDYNNVYISYKFNAELAEKDGLSKFKKYRGSLLIHYDGDRIYYSSDAEFEPKLGAVVLYNICVDFKNNLWIAASTVKGSAYIIKKSSDSIEIFDESKGFNGGAYKKIFEDSKGRIWISSATSGIYMYEYNK